MIAAGIPDRDRLPRWLYERYSRTVPAGSRWEDLPESTRIYWQEETDTVIRAVIKLAMYKIVER